ncbi:MAG TPA: LysM domain-containing protein, partial [Thermoanaerobaculia bacterium]
MFTPNSRYAKEGTYTVTRPDGTRVTATRLPLPTTPRVIGDHKKLDGQRLDLIAAHYLADATAFWRLCDANNSVVPDALAAHSAISIPEKGR